MGRARLLGLAVLLAIPFGPVAGRAATPSVIVFAADRGPQSTNEIFRLDPDGHRVNLDGGPSENHAPLVSPDGKEVAFLSYRSFYGDRPEIIAVRIDGTHPTNLTRSSFTPEGQAGSFSWQPHGDRLAAVSVNDAGSPNGLWILRRGHAPKQVFSGQAGAQKPSWSPDGRVLVAASSNAWRAFSPNGRRLWSRSGPSEPSCCGTSWSTHDVLAIMTRLHLRVFDENGHERFAARVGSGHISPPAWSPDAGEVAFVAGGIVEVRTAKGRLVLRRRVPSLDSRKANIVAWDGNHRIVAGLPVRGPQEGVDVRTGKLSTASSLWLDPRSADGRLAIVTPFDGANFSVGVEPVGSGPVTAYGALPQCGPYSPPAASLQFAGRSRSIVYESVCPSPFSYLYAMDSDGTDLHELTAVQAPATQPAISPDGTEIAYTGSSGILVANVDGTNTRVLAKPTSKPTRCTRDSSPTWSPDGKTILYAEDVFGFGSRCEPPSDRPELLTVPAAGGTPHYLGVVGSDPVWGPDRIAYRGEDGALTTADPDGSDPTEVSTGAVAWAWSPDGRLAYTTAPYGTTVVVGSNSVPLPFSHVGVLAWSPDGSRLVVTAETSANTLFDVYTVGTDGSDPVRLTTDYNASAASWR